MQKLQCIVERLDGCLGDPRWDWWVHGRYEGSVKGSMGALGRNMLKRVKN